MNSQHQKINKVLNINILDLKNNFTNNLEITCQLYKIFDKFSTECFTQQSTQLLCYDQLCINLDSINDNMRNIMLIKNLTCTVFQDGLCTMIYD